MSRLFPFSDYAASREGTPTTLCDLPEVLLAVTRNRRKFAPFLSRKTEAISVHTHEDKEGGYTSPTNAERRLSLRNFQSPSSFGDKKKLFRIFGEKPNKEILACPDLVVLVQGGEGGIRKILTYLIFLNQTEKYFVQSLLHREKTTQRKRDATPIVRAQQGHL